MDKERVCSLYSAMICLEDQVSPEKELILKECLVQGSKGQSPKERVWLMSKLMSEFWKDKVPLTW